MAKKKIKKALKNVAKVALPMLAMAGLGKAFMNSRARPLGVSGPNKALFTSNDAYRNSMLQNQPVTQQELMDFGKDQGFGFELQAKKGGRIVKGKKEAVRTKGFGKKKKQANRSKKK